MQNHINDAVLNGEIWSTVPYVCATRSLRHQSFFMTLLQNPVNIRSPSPYNAHSLAGHDKHTHHVKPLPTPPRSVFMARSPQNMSTLSSPLSTTCDSFSLAETIHYDHNSRADAFDRRHHDASPLVTGGWNIGRWNALTTTRSNAGNQHPPSRVFTTTTQYPCPQSHAVESTCPPLRYEIQSGNRTPVQSPTQSTALSASRPGYD
jgi:hypothetical protein